MTIVVIFHFNTYFAKENNTYSPDVSYSFAKTLCTIIIIIASGADD